MSENETERIDWKHLWIPHALKDATEEEWFTAAVLTGMDLAGGDVELAAEAGEKYVQVRDPYRSLWEVKPCR